jgi:hypothetical protein
METSQGVKYKVTLTKVKNFFSTIISMTAFSMHTIWIALITRKKRSAFRKLAQVSIRKMIKNKTSIIVKMIILETPMLKGLDNDMSQGST